MAKFIEHNNQTLLWNTITKIPLFNEKVDPDFQAQWFRDIIEKIYINQQHRLLNNTELNILNKYTISLMISSLKKIVLNESEVNDPYTKQTNHINNEPHTNHINNEPHTNHINNEKNNIVFEVIEDKAIDNMDELINQQIKLRELDLKIITPEQSIKKVSFQETDINESKDFESIIENLKKENQELKERINTLELKINKNTHNNIVTETLNDVIDTIVSDT